MKYGIINAMPEEMATLTKAMTASTVTDIQGIKFHEGTIYNQAVVVVESGIGKVRAGITTALLISNFNVDAIINSGSAGALGADLKIGDVVVATQTAYHDADATAFGYEYGQVPQQPARFDADRTLVADIIAAAQQTNLKTVKGLIVTADVFVADAAKADQIKKHFPDALSAEMEGAAVGQVATLFKVPYVVVRAMSDNADGDAGVTFDEFIETAGKQSAEMLLALFASKNTLQN